LLGLDAPTPAVMLSPMQATWLGVAPALPVRVTQAGSVAAAVMIAVLLTCREYSGAPRMAVDCAGGATRVKCSSTMRRRAHPAT
jgi:hypothetical protein